MFVFEELQPKDIPQVCALMLDLFERHIAQDFSLRSQIGIRQYLSPESMQARFGVCHFSLVCRGPADAVIGIIEIRDHSHICLLFVDEAYQQQGIARTLVNLALERCREHSPNLEQITVRAAPCAIPVYERLGFDPHPEMDEPDSAARAMRLGLTGW